MVNGYTGKARGEFRWVTYLFLTRLTDTVLVDDVPASRSLHPSPILRDMLHSASYNDVARLMSRIPDCLNSGSAGFRDKHALECRELYGASALEVRSFYEPTMKRRDPSSDKPMSAA